MRWLSAGERAALRGAGLVLGVAFLVGMAGGALALRIGAPVQTLQKVMTWLAIPWFGAWGLGCRRWVGRRAGRPPRFPS